MKCPDCQAPLSESVNFCSNCGKKFHDGPVIISMGKQISIYAVSILLPPLGLWPGFQYLFNKDKKAKLVGALAIILTIVSSAVSFWLTMQFMGSQVSQMNQLDSQIQELENLK